VEKMMPDCPNPAAHAAHMELNGECPWCDAPYDPSQILNPDADPLDAVAEVERRNR
jgi:hypothetical protein